MRLTLRTLLAYLDDTLDAGEAKEIGQKLAENPAAQELVDRVKRVTRSRGVAAPGTSIYGPNVVASYLSDALTGEKIAEFEKTCLESDVHLAEVAACHQILSLVVSEQVRVPPRARRRMYELVKGKESIPNRVPKESAMAVGGVLDDKKKTDDELDAGLFTVPDSDDEGSNYRVLLRVGGSCLLLVILCFTVWMALPTSDLSNEVKDKTIVMVTKPSEPAKTEEVKEEPKKEEPKKEEPKKEEPKKEEPKKEEPKKEEPKKEEPKKEEPKKEEPKKEEPKKEGPKVEKEEALPVLSLERTPLGQLEKNAKPPVVVRLRNGEETWTRVVGETHDVLGTEPIICLPGYRGTIRLDTDVLVELWSTIHPELFPLPLFESSITPSVAPPGFAADITLNVGRIYVSTKRPDGAKIRLRFRAEVWDVVLPDNKSEVVIETAHRLTPGAVEPTLTSTGFSVISGQASLKTRKKDVATTIKLEKGDTVFWDGKNGLGEVKSQAGRSAYWEKFTPVQNAKIAETVLIILQDLSTKIGENGRVRAVFDDAVQEGNDASTVQASLASRIAVLAFAALGDVKGLVSNLNDPNRASVRGSVVEGMRNMLAANPAKADEIKKMLVDSLRLEDAAASRVVELVRGPTEQERNDPETIDRLINELSSPILAIREAAACQLRVFIDPSMKTLWFTDAGAPSDVRESTIKEWKRRSDDIKKDYKKRTQENAVPPPKKAN